MSCGFCALSFWSIDSCQNSVSIDQHRLTVSRAQLSTHWVRVFFEVIRWQVATFQMIAGSSSIFFKCTWNKSCSWAAPKTFWFQTELRRENSTGFYMLLTFLTIVTHWSRSKSNFYALLVKIWQVSSRGKFMQHLETCLLIAEADRVLFHLEMFLTVFFYWMYKMKYSCYQDLWLVCLLRFWLRNAPLVKVIGNPISDGIVFKNELTHLSLFEA